MRLRPWMLVSAAWIGPAILGGLDVIAQNRIWGNGPVDVGRVLFVSLDWLLYALLTPFVFLIARRWPLARPHLVRHATVHLLFSLFFCAAWAGAIFTPIPYSAPQASCASSSAHRIGVTSSTSPSPRSDSTARRMCRSHDVCAR